MLFRHAKSDHVQGLEDRDRPLAERGHAESQLMGQFMAHHALIPALTLVSVALRTRQTWALAAPALGIPIPQRDEPRLYDASAQTILGVLKAVDTAPLSIVVVGHNPGISQLAARLAANGDPAALSRLRDGLPTAGLVIIDFALDHWSGLDNGLGTLIRFDTPKTIG